MADQRSWDDAAANADHVQEDAPKAGVLRGLQHSSGDGHERTGGRKSSEVLRDDTASKKWDWIVLDLVQGLLVWYRTVAHDVRWRPDIT